jgi:hypothetical protein
VSKFGRLTKVYTFGKVLLRVGVRRSCHWRGNVKPERLVTVEVSTRPSMELVAMPSRPAPIAPRAADHVPALVPNKGLLDAARG